MKKFAHLLSIRGDSCNKDEPLHSRFGRYRKHLEAEQLLHEFTARALKSFISLFDSFNDLRGCPKDKPAHFRRSQLTGEA
jgi:hypothetical protein